MSELQQAKVEWFLWHTLYKQHNPTTYKFVANVNNFKTRLVFLSMFIFYAAKIVLQIVN